MHSQLPSTPDRSLYITKLCPILSHKSPTNLEPSCSDNKICQSNKPEKAKYTSDVTTQGNFLHTDTMSARSNL
jgi:hypothetical protein